MSDPLEVRVRRLVVVDDQGRPRAVIDCGATPDPPEGAAVFLQLLAATGDPMIEVRLNEDGDPRLSIGHPDRGSAVITSRTEIQVWRDGESTTVLTTDPSD